MKMKKRIISIILAAATLLTAVVVIPLTFPVETEALYSPANSMYSGVNIISTSELAQTSYTTNNMSVAYDSTTEKAIKITCNSPSDPHVSFDISSLGLSISTYKIMVFVYKLPDTNSHGYPHCGYYWWSDNGAYTGIDCDCSNPLTKNSQYLYQIVTIPSLSGSTFKNARLDALSSHPDPLQGKAGDIMYLDSIAFFTDRSQAETYGKERVAVRNNITTYKISADSLTVNNAFTEKHNLTVSQGISGTGSNYFTITTGKFCTGGKEGSYWCNSEAEGCFDVRMKMGVNLDLSNFKYLVIPYKTDAQSTSNFPSVGVKSDGTTGYSSIGEPDANCMFVELVCDGGRYASKHYYHATEQLNATWYFAVIDLSANNDKLYELRLDPVNYTFSNALHYYIDSFYFCQTQDQIATYVNSVSSDPLTKISFNANAGGESVSGMPTVTASRYYKSWSINTYVFPDNKPTRGDGYVFAGWSTDPNAIEAQYQPGQTITAPREETVYYAVWKYSHGNLVINTKNTSPSLDAAQTYVFRIQGDSTNPHTAGIDKTVSVTGNDSVTLYLPVGEYTVTCLDHWSWRYTCVQKKQTIEIRESEGSYGLIFRFSQKNDKWLTDFGQS